MLRVNPVERPSISDIVDRLGEIAASKNVNLREPLGLKSLNTASPLGGGKVQIHIIICIR